jgi:uncharacterized RDD family membrane protein YckC
MATDAAFPEADRPDDVVDLTDADITAPDVPTVLIVRETVPRYIAASLDMALQMFAMVAFLKWLPPAWEILQAPVIVATYLGYFLLFEGFFGRTPGKLLMGLVVVQYDGRKCNWKQTWIRTLTRLLEVNPLLLGGIPAGILVVSTRYNQRWGDMLARTLVVQSRWL